MVYKWKNIAVLPHENHSPEGHPIIRVYVTKGAAEINAQDFQNIKFPKAKLFQNIVRHKDFQLLIEGIGKIVLEFENQRAELFNSITILYCPLVYCVTLGFANYVFQTDNKRLEIMFQKLKLKIKYSQCVVQFDEKYLAKGIYFVCDLKLGLGKERFQGPKLRQVLVFDFWYLKENILEKNKRYRESRLTNFLSETNK